MPAFDMEFETKKQQKQLANRMYIFCPKYAEKGIEIILQELPKSLEKFAGSLPDYCILSSKITAADWKHKVNGEHFVIEQNIGAKHVERIKTPRNGDFTATTIIVSDETFENIFEQIKEDKKHSYNNYTILNLKNVAEDISNSSVSPEDRNNINKKR